MSSEENSGGQFSTSFDLAAYDELFKSRADKRKDLVYMARTAEAAERYDDMCNCMRELVKECNDVQKSPLTVEERNLLSVAYKNVIGARRASYRTLCAESEDDTKKAIIDEYKAQVEVELDVICRDVLSLLEDKLVKEATDLGEKEKEETKEAKDQDEAQVFYLKMTGDYYRYLAEGSRNKDYENKSASYYGKAYAIAKDGQFSNGLKATHPIRLGLALNYSVCHYEILKDKKSACDLAKQAFDDAISKLDNLDETDYKDSTLIMQLLRDNLTLWTSGEDTDPEQDGEKDGEKVE